MYVCIVIIKERVCKSVNLYIIFSDECSCCDTNSIIISGSLNDSYSVCFGSIGSQSACTCRGEDNIVSMSQCIYIYYIMYI